MYKIIGADSKEYGPVSAEQLRQWLKEGRVNARTQILSEGATQWQPLNALPEFETEFSTPSTPPPLSPGGGAKTSGMAITSLALGILGLFSCGVTALVGLILGIVALVKIRNSQGRLSGNGLAIAGIVVSGIFLLLLPVYAALLLPALAKARERSQAVACVNNVKQLNLAARLYADANGNRFPSASNWCDALQPYVGSPRAFQCAADNSLRCAFAYNRTLDGLKQDEIDPRTVLFFESAAGWNAAGGPEMFQAHRHSRTRIVVGFADGSVQQLRREELEALRWEP
jgi:hypothetical protein